MSRWAFSRSESWCTPSPPPCTPTVASFAAGTTIGTISPRGREWLFALAALVLVGPAALAVAFAGSTLRWRDRLVAGWFGPKGFSSVVYGLLVARANLPDGSLVVHLIGATILLSIVAHSSTDAPVTRWYRRPRRIATRGSPRPHPGALHLVNALAVHTARCDRSRCGAGGGHVPVRGGGAGALLQPVSPRDATA